MDWPRITPSLVLRLLCLSSVAGVGAHSLDERAWGAGTWAAMGAVFCFAAAGAARRSVYVACGFLAVAFGLMGVWRLDAAIASAERLAVPTGRGTFTGRIVAVNPDLRGVRLAVADVANADGSPYVPTELFMSAGETYGIGDKIRWSCKPHVLPPKDDSIMNRKWSCRPDAPPEILGHASWFEPGRHLEAARDWLRRAAGRLWPEPEASFILGLLTGDDSGLTAADRQSFRDAGLSHVLAASGFNVARVADAALVLFAFGGFKRRRAAVGAIVAVTFFAGLTGNAASAVRAALMGGLALLAAALGKRYSASTALPLAAAVMLAVDPTALRHDVGFQLSFAAVWGLSAFGGSFEKRLVFLPQRFGLRRTAAETTAATVATMPLLLCYFGTLPLLSLAANLAVLPSIPWIMAASAVSLTVGAVWSAFGALVAISARLPAATVMATADFFGSFGWLALKLQPNPTAVAVLYAALFLLAFSLKRLDAARESTARLNAFTDA